MADRFELRDDFGKIVWEGSDRRAARTFVAESADLPEGDYSLWKFAGTFPVRVVPARRAVAFDSATKKGPRTAKPDGAAPHASEPVTGEPIA